MTVLMRADWISTHQVQWKKTYGLSYLLGGVYDAYAYDGQYGSITINIK